MFAPPLDFYLHAHPTIQCGQCFVVTLGSRTIHVLAIDHDDNGLNIAKAALNDLTDGQAVEHGTVDASVQVVDIRACFV